MTSNEAWLCQHNFSRVMYRGSEGTIRRVEGNGANGATTVPVSELEKWD